MKKCYLLMLGVLAMLPSLQTNAQRGPGWCDSEEYFQKKAAQNPAMQFQRDALDQKIRDWYQTHPQTNKTSSDAKYVIPLVVHIMNPKDACDDLITEAQVKASVNRLNLDFRKRNADTANTLDEFKPYTTDLEVEFQLAKIDPNGNCTNGITRSYTDLTYNADDPVKAVSYWDATKYFNIWVVVSIDPSGNGVVLGRAQFPSWTGFPGSLSTFGFLVIASEFADPNSRTATHEIGHCFGLYHTHQGGCGSNCTNSGDQVCDTPQEGAQNFSCNKALNTCDDSNTGLDSGLSTDPPNPIENYMSYASCQNNFTLGQKARVHAAIENSIELQNLYTTSNLIATGIDSSYVVPPCANFGISNCKTFVCEGTPIQFEDMSSGPAATSWSWDFGDGSTSNSQNPSVTYTAPGTYTVSLEVSDDSNSNTAVKTNYIEVLPTTGGEIAPFYESFEDPDFPTLSDVNKEWTLINSVFTSWRQSGSASTSGGNSLALRLSSSPNEQEYDIISPTIDFSDPVCTDLKFNYAYAQQSSASNDQLRVYTSKDCGVSWQLIYAKGATTLSTVDGGFITGTFVPDETQWEEESISLASVAGRDHILIRIQITSGSGNYFYIDDINIGCDAKTGVEESFKGQMSVYPNPFENDATIELNIPSTQTMKVEIMDVVGKRIYSESKTFQSGKNSFPISSLTNLDKGVYFITLKDGETRTSQKIVKF